MKLKNKVAIVTGAGRNIGKAIALAFAKEGADIVAFSRTLSQVEETAMQVRQLGRRSLAIQADVSIERDVREVVRATVEEFGRIDILVNNAGVQGPIGPMVDNNVKQWVQTVNINFIGTFLCAKAVLPKMMEQKQGKIINLSGGGSTSSRPFFSAYSTSRTAVVRLTETLADEVKDFNIQVNAIAPGAVNSKMLDEVLAAGERAGEKAMADARRQLETGGTPPEEAAALALFLASDDSGLTGRLISAVWDDWQNIDRERAREIISKELYTLRRIDGMFFRPKD